MLLEELCPQEEERAAPALAELGRAIRQMMLVWTTLTVSSNKLVQVRGRSSS